MAGSWRTSSRRRWRSTHRRAGSSRRWPRARTCAGSCRSSTRPGDAGASWDDIDAVAVTYGPGLAGSLLVGINFAKALAWVHERPLVGVNHLEGHVYAAWLRDPGEAGSPRSGLPAGRARRLGRPHVPGRDARPPDLPPARGRRSTTRRARRSTRSAGCSASATRAVRRSGARPRPRRAATASSRAPGWAIRTTSASRASRPRRAGSWTEARADAGLADTPEGATLGQRPSPSSRGASRTRSSTSWRRRRSGPPRRPARVDRAGRRRRGERGAARAAGRARPRRSGCR